MNVTDEQLMAYADGELDEPTRRAIEAELARNPALAARVQEHQALRAQLQSAFAPVLDERIPDRLTTAVHGKVTNLAEVRAARAVPAQPRWSWPQWIAVAASLLVGLFIGRHVQQPDAAFVTDDGEVIASGALAQALGGQLSNEDGPLRIALSYRNSEGQYCRSFVIESATAGVACLTADRWEVHAVVDAAASGSNYRMAGSEVPGAVREVIDASIAGEPLTIGEEQAARARGWR